MRLPSPAPAWITTSWPCTDSSRTPAGVIATRYSSDFVSVGTPTLIPASFLLPHDAVPGLAQHVAQDGVDLLELLGVRDERGRELDHGVAAVVGAADQATAVELAGEEAAQERLRLLRVERLLRVAVLDELDRLEVASPAHVADDGELAQPLEHRAELALLGAHVPAQVLALEELDVCERDRGGHGMTREREPVREHRRPAERCTHRRSARARGSPPRPCRGPRTGSAPRWRRPPRAGRDPPASGRSSCSARGSRQA